METIRTCPQCQQPLSADAPDGLCPQCLMRAASGPPPSAAGDGLPGEIIDIGDPAEVAKKLPQFEILELLGRGGMGVVYKARQLQLDRIVALKILPPVDALTPDFVARFTREARALAKLNHANIVTVHDFGETGGLYYIVMEYVDGANLRQLLESRRLAPAEALAIVPKICDALEYAHDEGLVHRDIKPENLLIDKKGRVKIADFGLAKLLRREPLDLTLTLSGMALGTLRYMAPEQMEKPETVDHRADIYSLGVVIYEMLTGDVPMGHFELPSQKAEVDVRLDKIVLHALERDADRRYQHASEIRTDVENVTSGPRAAPVGKSRSKGTGSSQVFPIRFWWRDLTDAVLTVVGTLWLVGVFWLLPAFVIRSLAVAALSSSQSSYLANMGGAFVFFGVMAVFTAGSIQSVRVDAEGLTINRFVGPSKFLPWATIRRIEPLSRWEVFRHIFLWPGLPPRGSIMCGTTRHVYRIDCQNDCWYFSPRHLPPFLAVIGQSHLGSEIRTDVENVTGKSAAPSPSSPPPAADVRPFSGEPRISRRAIIGAVWAVFGLLAILSGAFFIALNRVWNGTALPTDVIYERPPLAFTVFMGALLVIGSGAYIGTTVLGAMAVGQIRRSGGKIIGLPLAVADVLFFPLLLLGALVTVLATGVFQSFAPPGVSATILPGIAVALVVCFFVARAAWRSIAGTGAARAAAGSEARAGSADVVADGYRKVRAPAETLLLVAGVSLLTALGIAGWLWASSALHPESDFHPGTGQQGVAIIAMSATLAIHAVFIGAAGLLMRRLRARFFVLVCVVLVGLFIPAVLALNCIMEAKNIPQWPVFTTTWLGMPVCVWAALLLFHEDVRAAFDAAANVRRLDASQSSGETRLSVANANQASGIGRISLWVAIAGAVLPVLLAQGARLVAPSQRLPDFFVLCFVLGIVMELAALGCGIAARRTAAGKAGILTAGVMLMLGLLLGLRSPVQRGPSEAGRMETVSQDSAPVLAPGAITDGFGAEFTVPAGQVAIFEIVTRKDGATVPLPSLAAYVIAPAEQAVKGTYRWSREPVDFSSGTRRQPWRIEVLTPGGGKASSGGLDLPEALEAVVGSMSLGLGLEPDHEDIHWAAPDKDKLPADGLVGLRVRTQAHGIKAGMPGSAGGSGAATSDWQQASELRPK